MKKKTLVLDFDGVINSYVSGWTEDIVDPPNPGALEFCQEAIKHFDVHVHSSRCGSLEGRNKIRAWLDKHGFPEEIRVSEHKPPAFVTIDDRAITFMGSWPDMDSLLSFKPWNR